MRVIALAMMSLCATAASGKEKEIAAYVGPGAGTCSQYADHVRAQGESARMFYYTWAQGFMSGLNATPNLLDKPADLLGRSIDAQKAFIDQFCDQYPLGGYPQAVVYLYDAMRKEQGLHDWRPTPPTY